MPRTRHTTTISTLGNCIDEGYTLTAHCRCEMYRTRSVRLDLPALAERLGREHSSLAPDLLPRLRCSACGRRPGMLTVQPPSIDWRSWPPPAG